MPTCQLCGMSRVGQPGLGSWYGAEETTPASAATTDRTWEIETFAMENIQLGNATANRGCTYLKTGGRCFYTIHCSPTTVHVARRRALPSCATALGPGDKTSTALVRLLITTCFADHQEKKPDLSTGTTERLYCNTVFRSSP